MITMALTKQGVLSKKLYLLFVFVFLLSLDIFHFQYKKNGTICILEEITAKQKQILDK